jgi:hypothetical protein
MSESPSLAEEFAYLSAVFDGLVEAVVRFGRPMPRSVGRARGILDRALNSAVSLERQGSRAGVEQSYSENIGCDEVAKLLGVTPRTVQRNAEELGGRQVSGAWVFDREAIGADLNG